LRRGTADLAPPSETSAADSEKRRDEIVVDDCCAWSGIALVVEGVSMMLRERVAVVLFGNLAFAAVFGFYDVRSLQYTALLVSALHARPRPPVGCRRPRHPNTTAVNDRLLSCGELTADAFAVAEAQCERCRATREG